MRIIVQMAVWCSGLTLAWLGAGCGQTDPDGIGNGSDAGGGTTQIVANAEEALETFYPVPDGAYWEFNHVGGSEVWQEEVNVEEITYEGEPAILQSDNVGPSGTRSESTLVRKDDGIYRVHKETFRGDTLEESADYDPGFVRFRGQWVMEGAGFSETLEYQRRGYDENGILMTEEPRKHEYTVEGVGVQVTADGVSYEDCVHINRVRVRGNEPLQEGDDKDYWYCPGVGKVKEINKLEGQIEELLECEIPGGACPQTDMP